MIKRKFPITTMLAISLVLAIGACRGQESAELAEEIPTAEAPVEESAATWVPAEDLPDACSLPPNMSDLPITNLEWGASPDEVVQVMGEPVEPVTEDTQRLFWQEDDGEAVIEFSVGFEDQSLASKSIGYAAGDLLCIWSQQR